MYYKTVLYMFAVTILTSAPSPCGVYNIAILNPNLAYNLFSRMIICSEVASY